MSAWHLKGTILIACNCDYGCPCNFNALPTHGDCEGGWTWHVEDGRYGDVDLGEISFAVFADWPGAIHHGGGRAVAYVDDRATDGQRDAIADLVCGRAGGPWGIFINTYALDGPFAAPFEVTCSGDTSSFRIAGVAELAVEPIRNPVTGSESHPRILLPQGMVTKDAALLSSRVFRVDDGVAYDHSGKYAAVGSFEYTGP